MVNRNTKLEMPMMRHERKAFSPVQPIKISGRKTWELEQKIPLDLLYQETVRLEQKLENKKLAAGIRPPDNDLSGPEASELDFAHVLEHAILDVIDNQLQPHQLSTGRTYNAGINAEKEKLPEYDPKIPGTKIGHFRDIELILAPAIPPHLQQKYVDTVIDQLLHQIKETGKVNLEEIRL